MAMNKDYVEGLEAAMRLARRFESCTAPDVASVIANCLELMASQVREGIEAGNMKALRQGT